MANIIKIDNAVLKRRARAEMKRKVNLKPNESFTLSYVRVKKLSLITLSLLKYHCLKEY